MWRVGGTGAHPVVVARLLQAGAEEEAAAGDTCISGTLDVPVGAGLVRGPDLPLRRLPGVPVPGPAWGVRVCVVNHSPLLLLESRLACTHTALPRAQCVLGCSGNRSRVGRDLGEGAGGGDPERVEVQGEQIPPGDEQGPGDLPCSHGRIRPTQGASGGKWTSQLGRGTVSVGAPGGPDLLGVRGQNVSPPGNPTATTTSGLELKRELDSGSQSGPEEESVL